MMVGIAVSAREPLGNGSRIFGQSQVGPVRSGGTADIQRDRQRNTTRRGSGECGAS
jgi:hypothetical protein